MPIYEYECLQCGKRTEVLQRMGEGPIAACPACGGEVKKLISSPAFQFKGSGWYVTDYGGKKGGGSEGKSESKSEGKSEGASESKSESGSQSKSEGKSEGKSEKPAASESKGSGGSGGSGSSSSGSSGGSE